ncbi:hypothetical protein EV126DRAFT_206504 [Verticillium dahliae]|nr:hypothetical protein EV126DRAFT_206504 [Verticillium dahliae]
MPKSSGELPRRRGRRSPGHLAPSAFVRLARQWFILGSVALGRKCLGVRLGAGTVRVLGRMSLRQPGATRSSSSPTERTAEVPTWKTCWVREGQGRGGTWRGRRCASTGSAGERALSGGWMLSCSVRDGPIEPIRPVILSRRPFSYANNRFLFPQSSHHPSSPNSRHRLAGARRCLPYERDR